MSWKESVVIGATVLGMAAGVNQMLAVKTPADYEKYQQQEIVDQGSDAVEMDNNRKRDQLRDGIDAENSRKLVPSELRPAEPVVPKLRIRP